MKNLGMGGRGRIAVRPESIPADEFGEIAHTIHLEETRAMPEQSTMDNCDTKGSRGLYYSEIPVLKKNSILTRLVPDQEMQCSVAAKQNFAIGTLC